MTAIDETVSQRFNTRIHEEFHDYLVFIAVVLISNNLSELKTKDFLKNKLNLKSLGTKKYDKEYPPFKIGPKRILEAKSKHYGRFVESLENYAEGLKLGKDENYIQDQIDSFNHNFNAFLHLECIQVYGESYREMSLFFEGGRRVN